MTECFILSIFGTLFVCAGSVIQRRLPECTARFVAITNLVWCAAAAGSGSTQSLRPGDMKPGSPQTEGTVAGFRGGSLESAVDWARVAAQTGGARQHRESRDPDEQLCKAAVAVVAVLLSYRTSCRCAARHVHRARDCSGCDFAALEARAVSLPPPLQCTVRRACERAWRQSWAP